MSDHATPDDPPEPPRELWGLRDREDWWVPIISSYLVFGTEDEATKFACRHGAGFQAAVLAVHPAYRHHLRALLSAAHALLSGSGQEDAARRLLREAARAAGEFDGGTGTERTA